MSRGSGYHRDVRGVMSRGTGHHCYVWFNFLVYHPPPGLHVGKKNKSGDVPVVGTTDSFDGPWVRKGFQSDGPWARNGFQSDVPGVGTVNSGDVPTIPGGGMVHKKIEPDIT